MDNTQERNIKKMIDEADLISFDVFDTLLFRKVNSPETIFDLIGKHFGVRGFRKLRMDEQDEASRRTYAAHGYPHANIDEIYQVLSEHTEYPVNWDEVKAYEIKMESDALVANQEMFAIYQYAKKKKKRVVATTDMYLFADTIRTVLERNGYKGIDCVYCSADEHKAKFNKELFICVHEKEGTPYKRILHIGDSNSADVEIPESFGIKTFQYVRNMDTEKNRNALSSDIDLGLYKILHDGKQSFWYDLGVEAGGPLYIGLFEWIKEKIEKKNKKVYFLARDGYNLYHLFQKKGYQNTSYLYVSRRSLLLAGTQEIDEETLTLLPPFTFGQTIREIIRYLNIEPERMQHLDAAGFKSYDDTIDSLDDMQRFKKLYVLNEEIFLDQCKIERHYAEEYLKNEGFFDDDSYVFDCGWNGSSQLLIERFKKAVKSEIKNEFLYFGILNTEKSRRQLHGMHYDTYTFNFCTNYGLQASVRQAVALYELFFSAPHESVLCYDQNGVVFEEGQGQKEKQELLQGISDYLDLGIPFAEEYNVEYTPSIGIGHLDRLVSYPTSEEAKKIGNLDNVDGFARKHGEHKYIAYVTKEQYEKNPKTEIWWMQGLLKREDIPEELKKTIANARGIEYPKLSHAEYHLENEISINNYERWLLAQPSAGEHEPLEWLPVFSVVIPVYNTKTEQLREAIDSVLTQTYDRFELILVDDHSSWENVAPLLESYEPHPNVKTIYRETNGNISVATNDGIRIAKGDFIVFMDCDDVIDSHALYEFALRLNQDPELDFIYSDEDKITEDGKIRHLPFFKPDWSPDLFMSMMYTNHLGVYRTSIVKEIGGLRTLYNGSQDYDLTLRFLEKTENSRIGHIPKILYHWRERKESVAYQMQSKDYATEASRYAKEDALKRSNISAHLEYISGMLQYRTVYHVTGEPLVSIIIPSKDHPDLLAQCLQSIDEFTDYNHYEIIVVDNGSNGDNKTSVESLLKNYQAQYIYGEYDFNFSYMCNLGAKVAHGEYLLFLNDDVEMIQPDWLNRMLGQAQQKHTGAVGAKLLYPETTIIQHAGLSCIKEGPSHNFLHFDDGALSFFGFNRLDYNCIAVTGACLLIKNEIYQAVNGFDESFPVAYNDVELCIKIHKKGYYNVVRNDVIAYHHESFSRGKDDMDEEKQLRLSGETARLFLLHPEIKSHDPFLNQNLHTMSDILDPNVKYDPIYEWDGESTTIVGGFGNVDEISCTDRIHISGWNFVSEIDDNALIERKAILKDPYGHLFFVPIHSRTRMDVADALKRKDALHAGFECSLDPDIFRCDLMRYQIGILSKSKENVCYLSWLQTSNIHVPEEIILKYAEFRHEGTYATQTNPNSSEIMCALDQCDQRDDSIYIRGWAFVHNDTHYQYKTQILLRDEEKKCFLFEPSKERRLDVAISYPEMHFLYYPGFQCRIYSDALPSGHVYDVIIRLVNAYKDADKMDHEINIKIPLFKSNPNRPMNSTCVVHERSDQEMLKTQYDNTDKQKEDFILKMMVRLSDQQTQMTEQLHEQSELQSQYDEIKHEYERISNSTMWKMTGPVRKILDKGKACIRKYKSS